MGLYNNLKLKIAPKAGNDKVLVGKDGWLFFKGDNSLYNFANISELQENGLQAGLEYLKSINKWCKNHNKKFYYIIIPDKHRIYSEYYRLIKKQRSDDYGIAKQFVNYIKKNSDINVMYLQDDLLKHKNKGLLYFKQGTHWSGLGAYYSYNLIIDNIAEDFSLNKVKIDKWHMSESPEDMSKSLQSGNSDKASYGKIYSHPTYVKQAKCEQKGRYNRLNDGEINCINNHNKNNLFVLRDSFFSWLIPYVADTFRNTKILWKDYIDAEDLKNIEQNYDIVILENVERYIPHILNKKFPQNLIKEN